jgi:PCFT/HCP family folate transporter-like MFS transporter 1/3
VEPAILLFFFARYLYLPLYEQYYYVTYGSQILQNTSFPFPNGTFCLNSSQVDQYAGNGSYKWVETKSNNLVFYGQIATRIPQIIVSICLGPLSDRIGRKPIIILASVGSTVQGILSVIIVRFQWDPYYFILTNFIAGMTGSFTAILSSGLAYLSDVSSEKWRGMRLGILETVFSIGAGLGFLSTGYWLQLSGCDFIPPLWLYTACNFAIIIYIAFCMPESLSRSERKALAARNPKGLKSMLSGIKIFLGLVPRYSAWRLWAASLINNLMALNVAGAVLLAVYFLKCPPFDLSAQMIGLYQAIQSVSRAMTNAILMTVFSAIEVPEAALALIAMLFHSGCDLLTGFSNKVYQVYIGQWEYIECMSIAHVSCSMNCLWKTISSYYSPDSFFPNMIQLLHFKDWRRSLGLQ